jgi:protein-disulfide isomerase
MSKMWLSSGLLAVALACAPAVAQEEPAAEEQPAVVPVDPPTAVDEVAPAPPEDVEPASIEDAAPAVLPADLLAISDTDRILGDRDAPVTVVEFSSLTCPHCGAFHRDTLPALRAQYIDTGKVRYVIRHFPLDGVALQAAALADCMPADRYFPFIETLYTNQENWVRGQDPMHGAIQLARLSGMSEAEVGACLSNEANLNAVISSRLRAETELQVTSTPTFFINGERMKGAQPIEDMAAVIDPLLTQ